MRIARQSDYTKPRPPALAATLAAVNDVWSSWKDVADRVKGVSAETVKNNLRALAEESAVSTRYGAKGRVEYRSRETTGG